MNRTQRNTLERVRRTQRFLDANASVLDGIVTPSLQARLDMAVEYLAGRQLDQLLAQGMARSETANQLACRRDVYLELIRPIGRIADCAFSASRQRRLLVMSVVTFRSAGFMKRARRLAGVAEVYKDVFVSQGMPANFIDQLRDALDQIRTSIAAREHHKGRQKVATAELKAGTKSVRGIVGIIDALLVPTLRRDAKLFAGWKKQGQPEGGRQQTGRT